MNSDTFFLRLNSIFSAVVALDYGWNALLEHQLSRGADSTGASFAAHQFGVQLLRRISFQSPYLAMFLQYLPTFMMISLMICIYIQVRERSSILSRWALGGGIALAVILLVKKIHEGILTSVSSGYVDVALWEVQRDVLRSSADFTRLDNLQRVFLGEASALTFSLIGVLFVMGHGLERIAGIVFVLCFLAVALRPVLPMIGLTEEVAIFVLPAIAFTLSAVALWFASNQRPAEK